MMNPEEILRLCMAILAPLVIFMVLVYVGKFVFTRIKSSPRINNSRFLNLKEYLPEEEFTTIRQVFYLIMIVIFVVNILYLIFLWSPNPIGPMLIDIFISVYLVINGDITFSKNKLAFFLLIPFSSLAGLMFGDSLITILGYIHIFAFTYAIKLYYDKFIEYTETNSLGITILLLFGIVFVSFLFTVFVEEVSPIDSIVMVSNAFTSNGYAILGTSMPGKLNAILLVWSGFILSGVGTATLAVGIIMKYANDRFDRLEEKVKKNKKK